MATKAILPQSTSGAKPTANGHRPSSKVVPLRTQLAQQIDDLAALRRLLRDAQTAEKQLTKAVSETLRAAGLEHYRGERAEAHLEERTVLHPDPARFVAAVGPRAWEALNVRVEAARRMMAADDLEAISEKSVGPVLRLEAIEPSPAAA